MTAEGQRCRGGSARAPASDGRGVDLFDLCRQLERDLGEFAERARDRAQRDPLEGLTELGDSRVESLPQLHWAASGPRAGSQLVGELHVASAGARALGETDEIGVAHGRCLLLGGLGNGAHTLREAEVGRRFVAGLERLAPAHVGELDLFERGAGVSGHEGPFAAGTIVRMWSAICLGAAVGANNGAGGFEDDAAASDTNPGEASSSRARSRSDRRTRHVRPTRTAAKRPLLTQDRTVAGWSVNSSLTWATVSHGSSPDGVVLEGGSAIRAFVDGKSPYRILPHLTTLGRKRW
jgi:hypothetical protein